jgi:large subunit ribosomal protein L35
MPKMKTRKSVAKRFKLTAKGRVKFARPGKGHLLTSKSRKRKRNLRHANVLSGADTPRFRDMLTS